MNILGINGSPHEDGNTAYALRYALRQLAAACAETTYIGLAGKTINYCDGCFACNSGACVYDDDMAPILDAMRRCDCLLLASPVSAPLLTTV